jgi:zeaxanthin glucosyltransferase
MKLGFICLNVPGHLNPMTALARRLQQRHHEVIFLYSSEAAGLPVFPYVQDPSEPDPTEKARAEVSKMQGQGALQFGLNTILDLTESILPSLPTVVAETGVEALLIDSDYFYAELGAMALGIPYIHVANAMHSDYSGYTPLWMYGWPHENSEPARARNREGVARFAKMMEKNRGGIERYAESVGLKIDWNDLSFTNSPLASISQVPQAFDFENPYWRKPFYHTGPFHDVAARNQIDFPWERLTGQPLIYASMGTVLNGNLEVFQTIVTALTKHDDIQVVLSVGDQIDPKQIVSAPQNAIIVPQAPQLELLKRASVCITHAGLNTVLESLAQGVPQVAIPVTFDQPGVAARIAQRETGIVTSLEKLTPDHLSDCLNEIFLNPTYRTNAQKLQLKIAEANGLSVAADVIEKALGVKIPQP